MDCPRHVGVWDPSVAKLDVTPPGAAPLPRRPHLLGRTAFQGEVLLVMSPPRHDACEWYRHSTPSESSLKCAHIQTRNSNSKTSRRWLFTSCDDKNHRVLCTLHRLHKSQLFELGKHVQ